MDSPQFQGIDTAAEAIRNNELPRDAIDWLATNYYKTALELGHCLRLPEEGPCECDLYLTCPKFITTTQYAPRLRDRLCLERQLATNAAEQGWPREVERHTAIARRVTDLLDQLGEPPDGPKQVRNVTITAGDRIHSIRRGIDGDLTAR